MRCLWSLCLVASDCENVSKKTSCAVLPFSFGKLCTMYAWQFVQVLLNLCSAKSKLWWKKHSAHNLMRYTHEHGTSMQAITMQLHHANERWNE